MNDRLSKALDAWSSYVQNISSPESIELYNAWKDEECAKPDTITFTFPMLLINILNGSHGHWSRVSGIRRKQRDAVHFQAIKAFNEGDWVRYRGQSGCRWEVKITRLSPKAMDDDNLTSACKSVRDGISDALGFRDDSDERLSFSCGWEKAKGNNVRIEIRLHKL